MTEKPQKKKKSHYHGHRQRLRERLLSGDCNQKMASYEILECLLFLAIPRIDVKPLAKELMNTFGSFAEIIHANETDLRKISGVGDAVISVMRLIPLCATELARTSILNRPILSHWEALIEYLHLQLNHIQREEFHILFLNVKNHLICDEIQSKGTINSAYVYPREIIRRALELNSSSIILVHNHPSGDPQPSKEDIILTRQIDESCRAMDIRLLDHLIITKTGHNSFKDMNLI